MGKKFAIALLILLAFGKKKSDFNPESNAQFREGGAGTFSDGKLYSQVKNPQHYGRKVLTELVNAGSLTGNSLYQQTTYRHLQTQGGSSKVCVPNRTLGGEIRFESRVEDINIENGQVRGVTLASGEYIASDYVVLAVGHSARDTFQMLYDRGFTRA